MHMCSYTLVEHVVLEWELAHQKLTTVIFVANRMTGYQENSQQVTPDGNDFPEPLLLNATHLTQKQMIMLCEAFLQESKGDEKKTAKIQGLLAEQENQEKDDALCHMRKAAGDAQNRIVEADAALKVLIDAFDEAGLHQFHEAGVPELEHARALLRPGTDFLAQSVAKVLSIVNSVSQGQAVSMNQELKKKVNEVKHQVCDVLVHCIAAECTDLKSRESFMQIASEATGEDLCVNKDFKAQLMLAVSKVFVNKSTGESNVFQSNNQKATEIRILRGGGPRPRRPPRQKKRSPTQRGIHSNSNDHMPSSSCAALDPNWPTISYPHATERWYTNGLYSFVDDKLPVFVSSVPTMAYDSFYGPKVLRADQDEKVQGTPNTRVQEPIGASAPRIQHDHTATERSVEDSVIHVGEFVLATQTLKGRIADVSGYLEAPAGSLIKVLHVGTNTEETGWLYASMATDTESCGWVSREFVCHAELFHSRNTHAHSVVERSVAAQNPSALDSRATQHAATKTVAEHFPTTGDTGGSSSSYAARQCTHSGEYRKQWLCELAGGLQELHAEHRSAANGERYTKQQFCDWYGEYTGTERWNAATN